MLSSTPINFDKINKKDMDKEILRFGMIAELDAISLYEQMAANATNENIRLMLLDIAREEKTHLGEFETLLLKLDGEQVKESAAGEKEVEEKTE
jgi:rubrerythrin